METIPGVPLEYNFLISTIIGYFATLLVGPATAIAKKWFNTNGVSTVMISAALSTLVGVGITVYQAFSSGANWTGVLLAVYGLIKSNGDYNRLKQANKPSKEPTKVVVTNPQPLPTKNDDAFNRPATSEDFHDPTIDVK